MRGNTVFGHPQIILSFALTSLLNKTNLFSKGRFTKTYDDSYLLISTAKVIELQSSPRKWEMPVPHSAWQVLSRQVEEVPFGSNYPTLELTPGSHRSINISKSNRIADSALFQPFLLTGFNALVCSLLAVDLIQTRSVNREWRHFTWTSELKIKSLIVAVKCVSIRCHLPKALSSPLCISPFTRQHCESISGLASFRTWDCPFKGKSTIKKKKKERIKEENTQNTAWPPQDWWLEVPLSPQRVTCKTERSLDSSMPDAVSSGHCAVGLHIDSDHQTCA